MKHLFSFLLAVTLTACALFTIFCLDVSLDDEASLRAGYYSAHGLVALDVTLPEEIGAIGDAAAAISDTVPHTLSFPLRLLFDETRALLSGMREAYDRETRACTASP